MTRIIVLGIGIGAFVLIFLGYLAWEDKKVPVGIEAQLHRQNDSLARVVETILARQYVLEAKVEGQKDSAQAYLKKAKHYQDQYEKSKRNVQKASDLLRASDVQLDSFWHQYR